MNIIERIKFQFKPLAVHTEGIFLEPVWEEVKKKMKENKIHTWFCMTPANYEFLKGFYGISMTKETMSKLMKERYLEMIKQDQRLQLHVHLNPVGDISFNKQEELIRESIDWFKTELDTIPTEFVPGWFRTNLDTFSILNKFNLRLIKLDEFRATHDYDFVK